MHNPEVSPLKLNSRQHKAVGINGGPALVVAGAGTGKTRVIVERINRLLKAGTPAKRILALTFTEKAAAEMLDRVNDASGYQLDLPIMTFNAYGESLLRRYGTDIGLDRNFKLISENAKIVFLRERIDELNLDYYAPVSNPDGLLGDIKDYFSNLKQNLITPVVYKKHVDKLKATSPAEKLDKAKHQELAWAYEKYIALCRQANVIDYDDQIYLLVELLKQRPNVLNEVVGSYDYVMVDEFQDTNAMQSELVDLIVGDQKNLFVVGDDDQSIYGWRGATLANILDFKNRYPSSKEVTLIDNYRSTKEILGAAYQLIQNNNPFRLETRLNINKHLVSNRHGAKPSVYRFESLEEELGWVSQDIERRLATGTPAGSIAVLARRNALVERLHNHLVLADIEHLVIGRRHQLYQQPLVRNMLEAIKAVVDPVDNISLFHTLTGPFFDLSVHDIGQLAASARREHHSLLLAIEASTLKDAKSALEQLNKWRQKSVTLTVSSLAYEILDSSGYKDKLYGALSSDPSASVAVSRLAELFSAMKDFEQIALSPSAVQYVQALPALQAAGDSAEDDTLDLSQTAVNLLSVHKAKGLEWPIVYIIDCAEGSFPLRSNNSGISLTIYLKAHHASQADDHIFEERRLMYVAMTRARDELIATYSEKHGSSSTRQPSRFLAEAFGPDAAITERPDKVFDLASLGVSVTNKDKVTLPAKILSGQAVSLTVSQISKYLECPMDFYYRYVLNVPQEPNPALDYGVIIHGLLEEINKSLMAGKLTPLKDLKSQLLRQWPKAGYLSAKQRERSIIQAQKTLESVYHRAMFQPRLPVASEETFRFTLKDLKLTVNGRFDAIFPLDDNVEIVDYKTSTSVDDPDKAKRRATASQQLTLYALAWQVLHDELPGLLTLDFVDTGVQGSVKKTQRGIDGTFLRLQNVADGIRSKDFSPGRDHRYCQHPEI